jgi:hypothetical protein
MIQLSNMGPPERIRLARGSNPVHPKPPAAPQQRRHGAEHLPPQPEARGHAAVASAAVGVLAREIAQHFLSLGIRQERSEEAGCGAAQRSRHPALVRREAAHGPLDHGRRVFYIVEFGSTMS